MISNSNVLKTIGLKMELMFLMCLSLLMVSSNAQTDQIEWRCTFNVSHSCRHEHRWIPKTEIIEGTTNGYVVANINNGTSVSDKKAIIDANHYFISNRGIIRIWYRSETAEPMEVEGILSITACKSQTEPIFTVGHRSCSNWCIEDISYTCNSRSDVKVEFTATRGSEYTTIAIDFISITPTPDWEFSDSNGFDGSKIEQSDTDDSDWTTLGIGENAYFHAVFDQKQKGETAVFSARHQFTSPNGDMKLRYSSNADDVFLNVSSCLNNETVLSVSAPMGIHTSFLNYYCGRVDDVFFTFTAIRGHSALSIDIYLIHIFEGDFPSNRESSALTLMTTIMGTTTTTRITDLVDWNDEITNNPANVEATTSLATDMAKTTTALGNSSNDINWSIVISVIPATVAILFIACLISVAMEVRRRYKRSAQDSKTSRRESDKIDSGVSAPSVELQGNDLAYYSTPIDVNVLTQEGATPDLIHTYLGMNETNLVNETVNDDEGGYEVPKQVYHVNEECGEPGLAMASDRHGKGVNTGNLPNAYLNVKPVGGRSKMLAVRNQQIK